MYVHTYMYMYILSGNLSVHFIVHMCVHIHPPTYTLPCAHTHTHTIHTQLFDTDNVVNRYSSHFMFTTEGHLIHLDSNLLRKPWDKDFQGCFEDSMRAIARINESFVTHSVSQIKVFMHINNLQ